MAEISKEDFQSFQKQKSCDEIKESTAKKHDAIADSLCTTISELEKTVEVQQNYRQSCVLARLSQERDETARELKAKDQQIIHSDKNFKKILEERDEGAKALKAKDTKIQKETQVLKASFFWQRSCQYCRNDRWDQAGEQEAAHPGQTLANGSC